MRHWILNQTDIIVRDELREKFISFCRKNKKDNKAKEAYAEILWNEYRDIKINAYKNYYHDFAEIKIDETNKRSNPGVKGMKPSTNLKDYNLNLKNDLGFISILLIIVSTLVIGLFDILILINTLIILFILCTVCLIFVVSTIYKLGTSKFSYIENRDDAVKIKKYELNRLESNFKYILQRNRFQNGNIKWTSFEKSINEWYKDWIITKIPNPYEVDSKKQKVNSSNFITSGGVYAWWHQGKVIYIGKANNFKRRMGEHVSRLNGVGIHNEHKYNVGLVPDDIKIQILAITNDEDEQSVLESFYFDRYNDGNLLNSTGTLSWKKIMTRDKYRIAWDRIKDKII